jgi:hypothetical protein
MMFDRKQFSLQMDRMIKALAILLVSGAAMITAGKAMRRRIAFRKHFVRNLFRRYIYCFHDSFGSAHASSRRFFARDAQLFTMLRLK